MMGRHACVGVKGVGEISVPSQFGRIPDIAIKVQSPSEKLSHTDAQTCSPPRPGVPGNKPRVLRTQPALRF